MKSAKKKRREQARNKKRSERGRASRKNKHKAHYSLTHFTKSYPIPSMKLVDASPTKASCSCMTTQYCRSCNYNLWYLRHREDNNYSKSYFYNGKENQVYNISGG